MAFVIAYDNGSGYMEWACTPQPTPAEAWSTSGMAPGKELYTGCVPQIEKVVGEGKSQPIPDQVIKALEDLKQAWTAQEIPGKAELVRHCEIVGGKLVFDPDEDVIGTPSGEDPDGGRSIYTAAIIELGDCKIEFAYHEKSWEGLDWSIVLSGWGFNSAAMWYFSDQEIEGLPAWAVQREFGDDSRHFCRAL